MRQREVDYDEPATTRTPRIGGPGISPLRRTHASPQVEVEMLGRSEDPCALLHEMRDAARTTAKYVRRRRWLRMPYGEHHDDAASDRCANLGRARGCTVSSLLDKHTHMSDEQGAVRLEGAIGPSHFMYIFQFQPHLRNGCHRGTILVYRVFEKCRHMPCLKTSMEASLPCTGSTKV